MYAKYVVLALCCVLAVDAQVMGLGSCPDVSVVAPFDSAAFLGKWFEYARSFAVFQAGGKCTVAEYSLNQNGTVGVKNTQINSLTGKEQEIEGYATVVPSDIFEAKLEVVFPSAPLPAPYWVLGSDYTNYAVVWSCTEIAFSRASFAWVLTREQFPSQEVVEAAYSVFDANNIERDIVSLTDHTDCADKSA